MKENKIQSLVHFPTWPTRAEDVLEELSIESLDSAGILKQGRQPQPDTENEPER